MTAEGFLHARSGPVELYLGDAVQVMRQMPEGSADCVFSSPPYFGLRDYGTGSWAGGDATCAHRDRSAPQAGQHCPACGARWDDRQLGLEATLEDYIARLVDVFAEAHRILADDGTAWLSIGDCYAAPQRPARTHGLGRALGAKQLLGVPWRAALALQDSGWILRNAVVWAKTNPMPSSVTDRFTTTHEMVFLLTKSARYWFDLDPVRVPLARPDVANVIGGAKAGSGGIEATARTRGGTYRRGSKHDPGVIEAAASAAIMRPTGVRHTAAHPAGRNPGDVWHLPTRPYRGAHVATGPVDLPLRAIAAGCRPGGTVLDPFSGAATTGLAALQLGRRYRGVDLDPDCHEQALRRLAPFLA